MKNINVKLVFYRTLFSQSAASVTMGSLSAFLSNNKIKNNLVLLEKNNFHSIESIFENINSKTVIIAKPNFKDYYQMFQLLSEIKKHDLVNKIFLCGPYASLNYNSLMKELKWLDGIIIGNTEETAVELLELLEKRTFNCNCPGGVWRNSKNGVVSAYYPRKYKLKLNNLPFPDRTIEKHENGSYINIEASRGCPGACSFCHIPLLSKLNGINNVDYRDPLFVVDEIEFLFKNLEKKLFIFNDSCFWRGHNDDKRILKICSEIKKRKLPIKFYIYLKCSPFPSDDILKKMVESGLVRVFLGVENHSQTSKTLFNKKIKDGTYELIKERLDKYHVNVHIGFIIFEPYTSINEVSKNIKYLKKIGKLFRIGVFLEEVRIIPYSILHKKLIKDGLINKSLSYKDITYGYKFRDKKTEEYYKLIKEVFFVILKEQSYEFEYYCTTVGLIKDILYRFDNKNFKKLNKDFLEFKLYQDKIEKLIYVFLIKSIKSIKTLDANKIIKEKTSSFFIRDFNKFYYIIKVKYANIFSKINQINNGEYIKLIYSGYEQIK